MSPVERAQSAHEQLDAVQAGFRERMLQEQKRVEIATDSEYWVAVCFTTREQKEEFLEKLGLLDDGDKYLDGRLLAEKLKVQLETPDPQWGKARAARRMADLADSLAAPLSRKK